MLQKKAVPHCWCMPQPASPALQVRTMHASPQKLTVIPPQTYENCKFSSAVAGSPQGMRAILATYSTGDAALIPAPGAITKVLLLNATASARSSRTSSELRARCILFLANTEVIWSTICDTSRHSTARPHRCAPPLARGRHAQEAPGPQSDSERVLRGCASRSSLAGCDCHDELMKLRSTNSAFEGSSPTPCFARRPTNIRES